MFRELVKSPEGLRTLHKLAETGMQAWRCPPDAVNCLKDAFHDITIRALMLATLEHFAATAAERIVLSAPPAHLASPLPPKISLRPERPQRAAETSLPHSSFPRRPSARPGGSGPRLG